MNYEGFFIKGRAETLPKPEGRKVATLSGTDPDSDYFCFPRASVIGADFHWLAVLNPCVRINPDKTGHAYFNLKFRASVGFLVSFHQGIV